MLMPVRHCKVRRQLKALCSDLLYNFFLSNENTATNECPVYPQTFYAISVVAAAALLLLSRT